MKTSIHTRFLAMLMALVMVLSMVPATAVRAQEETPTYTLVTDAASLKEGDQVLVVASGFPVALSTNQKTNNRGQSTVTKSEDGTTVTPGDDTQVITLGKGTKDGTWALKVDGGASANNFLMQCQADISQAPVERPCCIETTAMGAAYLAGLAVGYWPDQETVKQNGAIDRTFEPELSKEERDEKMNGWHKAVRYAEGWAK